MSEVSLPRAGGANFDASAQRARFGGELASVTPITDAVSASEKPRGAQRLDIRNPRDVQTAAKILVAGEDPLFARFGNILGVFGHPSAETVGNINEFKGRPRSQTGSVTTSSEHYESLADWEHLDGGLLVPNADVRLNKETALTLIDALSKEGPVGVLLPAADHIPGHLSRTEQNANGELRTVQLIVPGQNCPSTEVFSAAVNQLPDMPIIFATSGNMSKTVMKSEQPAHYDYDPLVREFTEQGKGDITVITDSEEEEHKVRGRHRYHDQRSTTILRLDDVVREEDGAPKIDKNGRPILKVQRHGSMHAVYLRDILAEHGFGIQFPPEESRVPIRTDASTEVVSFVNPAQK